jgi:hypothetical protein
MCQSADLIKVTSKTLEDIIDVGVAASPLPPRFCDPDIVAPEPDVPGPGFDVFKNVVACKFETQGFSPLDISWPFPVIFPTRNEPPSAPVLPNDNTDTNFGAGIRVDPDVEDLDRARDGALDDMGAELGDPPVDLGNS